MAEQFIERRIITGMVVDTEFLKAIARSFKPEFIQAQAARTLASWCVRYFKKYRKADMEAKDDE